MFAASLAPQLHSRNVFRLAYVQYWGPVSMKKNACSVRTLISSVCRVLSSEQTVIGACVFIRPRICGLKWLTPWSDSMAITQWRKSWISEILRFILRSDAMCFLCAYIRIWTHCTDYRVHNMHGAFMRYWKQKQHLNAPEPVCPLDNKNRSHFKAVRSRNHSQIVSHGAICACDEWLSITLVATTMSVHRKSSEQKCIG